MSRTRKDSKYNVRRARRLSVKGVHRTPPDLSQLSRAVMRIALEQLASEKAAAEAVRRPAQKATEELADD